jgi:hypothetical protein
MCCYLVVDRGAGSGVYRYQGDPVFVGCCRAIDAVIVSNNSVSLDAGAATAEAGVAAVDAVVAATTVGREQVRTHRHKTGPADVADVGAAGVDAEAD